MSISPGYSASEIRDLVFAYERVPHGSKEAWLAEQGISRYRFRKWQMAVYLGDVDRGLVPRTDEGDIPLNGFRWIASMTDDKQAKRIDALELENEQLRAALDAMGKAIALLHEMQGQERESNPTQPHPNAS